MYVYIYVYNCIYIHIYKTLVVTSFCKNPDSTEEPSDHRVKRNQTISNMVYWKIAHFIRRFYNQNHQDFLASQVRLPEDTWFRKNLPVKAF